MEDHTPEMRKLVTTLYSRLSASLPAERLDEKRWKLRGEQKVSIPKFAYVVHFLI